MSHIIPPLLVGDFHLRLLLVMVTLYCRCVKGQIVEPDDKRIYIELRIKLNKSQLNREK